MEAKVIVHGGFFSESSDSEEVKIAKQNALKEIVGKTHQYLQNHNALESVVYGVSLLEDCDLFNAGLGSQIQSDGKIRLSASLMDGGSKKFSGVINIEDVKNPIYVAHKLMDFDDKVLSGQEALHFARKNGFNYFNPETPQRKEQFLKKLNESVRTGTVGCVAIDKEGKLAAATSTGGKGFEIPGRVSDSATVAGNYANDFVGVSCTGVGEDIVSAALAAKIATRMIDGFTLKEACDKSMQELQPFHGFAGVICISSTGEIYHIDSHPYMVWAYFDKEPVIFP
ncbi:isoaspartyl peptidase/L-asparaginase [Paradesertivirga mongoliensis]|uniref:Isoaspartyl peptidase/L-asparaginase n=1 Tax=Paradesertivirga mongoliensis TaxID=2100740 RepID=A0ABW4ZIP5_9SPHI|nr:isoaspartyl peptidase/L-asparaginase [Pedobacter mongoliensis]